ncbi:MAG: signal peptidase I [Oscillospiraceae bacterium]|nr:signal peptidase I [Oscillospiraceae bacterium]
MAVSQKIRTHPVLAFCKKLSGIIVSVLTTAIIVTAAVIIALFFAKIKPYVVVSGSMEPAIHVHSVCFVNENVPLEDIVPGDVISFRMDENMLVTHRVTAVSDGSCTTKGDANSIEDASPVTASNYIGKTVFVVPKIGAVMVLLHTTWGRIAAGGIIILLFILSFISKEKPEQESSE